MEPLSGAEIRERFLRFYEERGHERLPSDSLIPHNDPTLLFTGAGMNQFKDMFLGKGTLPHNRVATSQKCLRVPDLEQVGRSPRHHTFFEMLGHFSFGDYFKEECIAWEWEFFTKALGIPEEQLVATVYEDDEVAYKIWRDKVGLEAERIYRFDEKENFWPAEAPSKGPNGPCGPCSEIYFDHQPGKAYPKHDGLEVLPDRFTEIGNCVFTQFDRQPDGSLAELPQCNIDVGLGLERITAVLQGVASNFDTDLFRPYLDYLQERSGKVYGKDKGVDEYMRRISDHVRALTFCIADGATPSNEGRGYVVRKILRRASRDGYELGIQEPFLCEMVAVVGASMGEAYPEVISHAGQCRSLIKSEEESFRGVYRRGLQRLQEFLGKAGTRGAGKSRSAGKLLEGSGEFAFELHDTHGFPVDITRQVLADHGLGLDEQGFEQAMEEQRQRARAASRTSDEVIVETAATRLNEAGVVATGFIGYRTLAAEAKVLGLLGGDTELMEALGAGQEAVLVVDQTPFYAEGGGQVGDRGTVAGPAGRGQVQDTTAVGSYHLHRLLVEEGRIQVGDSVQMCVDENARRATERNHTATHLLHAALKTVLGDHVSQAGSVVAPDRLRFDFTHGEKLTPEQIRQIEDQVNQEVMKATPVEAAVRSMDEARAAGFVALFGEKYGDQVRTLAVGEYSKELCGGTHVANSGAIGAFRITSETAISAGTRRLEAVTGFGALGVNRSEREALASMSRALKTPVNELPDRVAALMAEAKKLRKDLAKAQAKDLTQVLGEMRDALVHGAEGKSVVHKVEGLTMKDLQDLLGRVQKSLAPAASVVLSPSPDGVLVGAVVSKDLTDRVRAGDLVKELTQLLGGGGGGRPEMTQGKGPEVGKVDTAAELARDRLAAVGLA